MEPKAGKRPKTIEEVVQYALGHRTRVHILILLNDGIYTTAQLAEIIGEPPNNVANHLTKMLEDGSIEIASKEEDGNIIRYGYKAVEMAVYSTEAGEAMTPVQRQMTVGAIYQSGSAETMAALYAGTLADPRTAVFWDDFNVDSQGREDLEDENRRYLDRIREIEVESVNRRAKSGEELTSMMVHLYVYERARKRMNAPPSRNDERSSRRD